MFLFLANGPFSFQHFTFLFVAVFFRFPLTISICIFINECALDWFMARPNKFKMRIFFWFPLICLFTAFLFSFSASAAAPIHSNRYCATDFSPFLLQTGENVFCCCCYLFIYFFVSIFNTSMDFFSARTNIQTENTNHPRLFARRAFTQHRPSIKFAIYLFNKTNMFSV